MKRHVLSLAGALVASYALAACGRSELDVPEDVPDARVVVDVPLDRADTPDVPDVLDVPDVPDVSQCMSARDCDDGRTCNGAESCTDGRCLPGAPPVCNDGVVCTVDQCVEGRGCIATPDNNRCISPAFCDPVRDCTPVECVSDANCDDGDPCDGVERCTAGRCVRGAPLACDDGVACTRDRCVPGRGCLNAPDDMLCNDGTYCNGVERCLPVRGCFAEMAVRCDDGDACTADACDEGRRACITRPTDNDGDGFGPVSCAGGRDCDDNDRSVNPGAPEICLDGRDNNCDGRSDCADGMCAGTPGCAMCVPTGAENCNDGRDNDCNGATDCADPGCAGSPLCAMCVPTGVESDPDSCADGIDNDCDGQIDCADMFCVAQPVCSAPPPNDTCATPILVAVPSSTTGNLDGARNDFTPVTEGFPGCAGGAGGDVVYALRVARDTTLTIDTLGSTFDTVVYVRRDPCQTGAQVACNDDSAGLSSRVTFAASAGVYYVFVDGFGGGSRGNFVLNISEGAPREICNNLRDDDGDEAVDCADTDCTADPLCRCVPVLENTDATCRDRRDNDCDGQADCADTDCRGTRACCRPTGAEADLRSCTDGVDNDCDGLLDCADPGCAAQAMCCRATAAREIGVGACTDGLDNDCDGVADCSDSDCRPSAMSGGECCNGADDNGNRLIDEFACGCETSAQCSGVGSGGLFPSNTCWTTTYRLCAPRCDLLGGNLFCNNFFAGTTCNTTSGECTR